MSLLIVDGCKNYTVLSEADRAQGHLVINSSSYRCDRDDLVPGWYRFQGAAGDQMADKCVPMNHCGTRYPGWLNGPHPTVAEGVVNRTVCYPNWYYHHYYYWYQSENCCYWSNNIRVKNCGAFFVYELQKPPGCSLRYCGNGSAGNLPCLLISVCHSTISYQAIIIIIRGVARIFQRGVTVCQNEGTHQIVMSFSPPVVGCLLKKAHKRGGHRHPRTPPPWLRP